MFIHDILIYLIIIGLCIVFSIILDIYRFYKTYTNKKRRIKNENNVKNCNFIG